MSSRSRASTFRVRARRSSSLRLRSSRFRSPKGDAMKHAVAALLALVLVGAASQARAGDLEDKRDKLLAEEWLKKAPWITDYDKARDAAKASGKTIFAYFTRSYAL